MRKWMRERIQRRKKKSDEQETQPAPPPLQPAYFESTETPQGKADEDFGEPAENVPEDRESEPEPPAEDAANTERSAGTTSQNAEKPAQRGRGRRRRGGRGRGGRGREQAVAQAFTPKGIPSGVAEASEPEAAAPDAVLAEPEVEGAPEAPVTKGPATPAAIPAAPGRPPKGIVVLAIGLPGSGKSTWFKRHNLTPLSSDMVRSLLFDDVREQRFQDLVFSNLRSMLKARLIAKRPMNYVDATNLTPQERQHWIKLAKDYGYEVHAVFFDVPLEVCVERHQRRDRVVPEDVMRRMAAKLKPPAFQEGFAKITVVRVKKKDQESAEA